MTRKHKTKKAPQQSPATAEAAAAAATVAVPAAASSPASKWSVKEGVLQEGVWTPEDERRQRQREAEEYHAARAKREAERAARRKRAQENDEDYDDEEDSSEYDDDDEADGDEGDEGDEDDHFTLGCPWASSDEHSAPRSSSGWHSREHSEDEDESDEEARYDRYERKQRRYRVMAMHKAMFSLIPRYRFVSQLNARSVDCYLVHDGEAPFSTAPPPYVLKLVRYRDNDALSEVAPMEVRTMLALRRVPGVMPLVRWHRVDRYHFALLMPHVPSAPFHSLFGDALSIYDYMRQLMAFVMATHKHGILHRDYKPSNVLWDAETRHLTVCDFGLAITIEPRIHYSACGTNDFRAPEVRRYQGYVPASDVFSCGVMFGLLLFGLPDWHLDQDIIRDWAYRRGMRPLLPAEDLNFLSCMVNRKPEDRPTAEDAHRYFQRRYLETVASHEQEPATLK